jgi:hypothetical protein
VRVHFNTTSFFGNTLALNYQLIVRGGVLVCLENNNKKKLFKYLLIGEPSNSGGNTKWIRENSVQFWGV